MSEFIGNMQDKPKRHHTKLLVLTVFIFVLGFLILTSFFGFALTGNVIDNITPSKNSTISIKADLTIPDLDLDGKFGKVTIKGGSNSDFYVGNQKFYLGNSNNNIITIEDFDGDLSLDISSISFLKGKAAKVSVNGVPVTPKNKGDLLSLNIGDDFRYNFLEIAQGVSIKELDYLTSGTINNEKNIFKVENDQVFMKDFQGKLTIESSKFKVEGKVSRLEIKGTQGVSITS